MQSKYSWEHVLIRSPSFCFRSEGFDKSGQYVLYELHCPGPDSHPTAEGLLPVRQTQMWDASQLLPCVWDVSAFSGGEMFGGFFGLGFLFWFGFFVHFYVALLCAQNHGIFITEKIMLPLNLTQRTAFKQHLLSDQLQIVILAPWNFQHRRTCLWRTWSAWCITLGKLAPAQFSSHFS